jgi:hypothetical protein
VVIDGKEMGKVNTFTPLNKEVQLTKTYDGLAEGKHTVTVAVTGEKDSLSKNTFINVLKLEVIE